MCCFAFSVLLIHSDMQSLLVEVGAVKENDHRILHNKVAAPDFRPRSSRETAPKADDNDDDEWD